VLPQKSVSAGCHHLLWQMQEEGLASVG
jgi:hypothetical protein